MPVGRWVATLANLLILYGLLVAYLSGGTSIIVGLFRLSVPNWAVTLLFFAFSTGFTLFGVAVVRKGNFILMAAMWLAFIALIVITIPQIKPRHLTFIDWGLLPSALPIMVTAFHFHNIIPTVCRSLEYERTAVLRALLIGTIIGLGMNAVWNLVVMGGLSVADSGQNNILYAFEHGLPATVPLSKIIASPLFTTCGLLFAILAITTSYLANGTALMNFVQDMSLGILKKKNRVRDACLAFGPPLMVTLGYPNLFLKALDVVGGVGIAVLFGILPGILAVRQAGSPRARAWGLLIIACFLVVLLFEIGQEAGLLKIDPEAELWKAGLKVTPTQPR